ncbi:hypothetical protein BVY03_02630 [bacterium K02(2017)]|nr:hypothetical protein BVY03_02630 [bacterium K02(2017)]
MAKAKDINLKQLVSFIKKSKKVLIATHQYPDGDGIGSIIALGEALKQLNKQIKLYIIDPVPKMYQFLPGHKKITKSLKASEKFDLTIMVDLGEIERVGSYFADHQHRGTTISVDHHIGGEHNCDYNFCLPHQASSGEVVYKVLKALKTKFNHTIAMGIYTAMVTDTGSFKYSNTTQETFEIAADISRYKIDYWKVALNCFETYSIERMSLLKRVMARMETHPNKKIAWIVIKNDDFKKTGACSDDTEGFINFPRSIEGVEVAIAFKEMKSKLYKISLRSKNYVNVAKIAEGFSGGGHMRASGLKIEGSFETVKKTLFKEIIKKLK